MKFMLVSAAGHSSDCNVLMCLPFFVYFLLAFFLEFSNVL